MLKKLNHLDNLTLAMNVLYYVGFIVIIFFMTTSKLRAYFPSAELRSIQLPYSTLTSSWDPDGESATIYIGPEKVMFSMSDTLRRQTLIAMGKKYHINFSNSEIVKFKDVNIIGAPVDSLKRYINNYNNSGSYDNPPGIRIDSTNDELADWIKESRKVCYNLCNGERLHFYIYADKRNKYSQIKRIFDILEQQGEHKWSLLTWTKSRQ